MTSHHPPKTNTYGPGESANLPASQMDLHCFTETNGVITTTMFDVPGYRVVKVLGAVYGLTVRSRNWAAGLTMVIKSIAGGELQWFTNMVSSSSVSASTSNASFSICWLRARSRKYGGI